MPERPSGKGILTHENFPDDLDTTALGLVTMKPPKEHVHSLMDEMLTYLNEDGLPYVSQCSIFLDCSLDSTDRPHRPTSTAKCPVWTR